MNLILFLEMLKNQHVRIDCHANREYDASDTRKRQRRIEQIKQSKQHDRVRHKRNVGNKSGHAIKEDHEDEDGSKTDSKSKLGLVF